MKTLYDNGRIYTGGRTTAEAFAVENGRFFFVGSREEGAALGCDERVDLGGAFVCPGFNDSHMHLLNFGQFLHSAHLNEHTGSLREMLEAMRTFAGEHPPKAGQWLVGRGWNDDYFTDVGRMPSRDDLDGISREIPIIAVRCCGHCLVANSKVLELCGVTEKTPAPAGGRIGMENGRLDGRFYDDAMELIYARQPAPDLQRIKEMLRSACAALNSYGVTSCQTDDYCVFRGVDWRTVNQAYRELEQSGELTVRVYEQSNFTSLAGLREFVAAGCRTGAGSDRFRIGPLKMLGDGSLGARTAYLSRPYADAPDMRGILIYSRQELEEMIGFAHEQGMQAAVHAIGDGCLDAVLDAYEKALTAHPRPDHRHGIVHCQISRPDQLARIARLGLHVYAQSIFLDYDVHIVEDRVGKTLAASSYSWKTLMEKGVCVSNGSDCPVELPDVMAGIQCAVTRSSLDGKAGPFLPREAFTVSEALDSYTIRGAEASFEETRKGKIAPGYLADFTVLGADPFETAPSELKQIPVLAAYLEGEPVYRRA